MAQSEWVEIEVVNWDKFNPRKDLKATAWFRMQNTVLEDPNFEDLSDAEFRALIFILSQCSKRQTGRIRVHFANAERLSRVKKKDVLSAIEKLSQIQFVQITSEVANTHVTSTSRARTTTNERTDEHNKQTNTLTLRSDIFDFESVYQNYPRKSGKTAGLKKAAKEIKTPADLELLKSAVKRFTEHHVKSETEPEYIPYFSTFMSSWRDWLEPETGQSVIKTLASQETNRFRAEIEALERAAKRGSVEELEGDVP